MTKHCWRKRELVVEKEKHLAGSKLRAFPAHPRLLPSSISLRPGCLPDISCLMLVSISSLHSPFPQTELPPASFPPFSHSGLHFPTRIFFFSTLILTCNSPTKHAWVSSPSWKLCVADLSLGPCGIYLGHWGQVLCSGSHQLPAFFGDLPAPSLFSIALLSSFILWGYSHFCSESTVLSSHFKFLKGTNCLLSVL